MVAVWAGLWSLVAIRGAARPDHGPAGGGPLGWPGTARLAGNRSLAGDRSLASALEAGSAPEADVGTARRWSRARQSVDPAWIIDREGSGPLKPTRYSSRMGAKHS
jgi:hypothetical protein